MAIKAVTFDAVNTLIKVSFSPGVQYSLMAAKYGLNTDSDVLNREFKKSFRDKWASHPNYGREFGMTSQKWWEDVATASFQRAGYSRENVSLISTRLFEHFKQAESWDICPGTTDLLSELKAKGLILGVISNSDARLHAVLDNLDLSHFFSFVVTSYEAGLYKPNPELFQYTTRKYLPNVELNRIMHVGDDYELDFVASRNAGNKAILIGPSNKLPPNAGKFTVPGLCDVAAMIHTMN